MITDNTNFGTIFISTSTEGELTLSINHDLLTVTEIAKRLD